MPVLTTTEIVSSVERLVRDAQEMVVLASAYVDLDGMHNLVRAIVGALERGVKVTLVGRSYQQTSKPVSESPAALMLVQKGMRLFEALDLHAKLYLSEKGAIITSFNLLPSSAQKTIEIGMYVPADRPEYQGLMRFVREEIRGKQVGGHDDSPPRRAPTAQKSAKGGGCCIRCGEPLPYNPERPYCRDDYAEWAEYQNPDYEDRYCHGCGTPHPATMNRPLCRSCFRRA